MPRVDSLPVTNALQTAPPLTPGDRGWVGGERAIEKKKGGKKVGFVLAIDLGRERQKRS